MPHEQAKMSPQRYAKLMRLLIDGEYNCRELAELTDLHYVTVLDYTRALKEQGVIYISRWERDALGRDAVKVYKIGPGPDIARRTLGRNEAQQRYRQRKRLRAMGMLSSTDEGQG